VVVMAEMIIQIALNNYILNKFLYIWTEYRLAGSEIPLYVELIRPSFIKNGDLLISTIPILLKQLKALRLCKRTDQVDYALCSTSARRKWSYAWLIRICQGTGETEIFLAPPKGGSLSQGKMESKWMAPILVSTTARGDWGLSCCRYAVQMCTANYFSW
jgi:hypothetical protein